MQMIRVILEKKKWKALGWINSLELSPPGFRGLSKRKHHDAQLPLVVLLCESPKRFSCPSSTGSLWHARATEMLLASAEVRPQWCDKRYRYHCNSYVFIAITKFNSWI